MGSVVSFLLIVAIDKMDKFEKKQDGLTEEVQDLALSINSITHNYVTDEEMRDYIQPIQVKLESVNVHITRLEERIKK